MKKPTFSYSKRTKILVMSMCIFLILYITSSFTDIIEDNLPFKMPCRLGVLRVKKSKMNYKDKNKLKVDWKTSKEANKIVYHLNDHTNGYKFRFWWEKRGPIKNLSVYSFTPIREYKRLLSSILKDKNRTIDYFM